MEPIIKDNMRPKVGTAAVVMRHDRADRVPEVLLLRRATNNKLMPGVWCLPGGWMEGTDAGPVAAAIRELEEETGLTAESGRVLTAGHNFFQHPEDGEWSCITLYVVLRGWMASSKNRSNDNEPCIMEPEKADSVGWFPVDSLPPGSEQLVPRMLFEKFSFEEEEQNGRA